MSSFSQRFVGHHRFFSDAIEDILALTLCLPFTMVLYWWNDLTDRLSEFSRIPNHVSLTMWNVGRYLFTFPLFVLKGLASLTLAPLLATWYALQSKEPTRSRFILGQYFQKFAIILNPIIKLVYLVVLACMGFNFLGTNINGLTDIVLIGFTLAFLVYPAIVQLAAYSTAIIISLIASATVLNLEGNFSPYRKITTYSLDTLINIVQKALLLIDIYPYKNKEDIVSTELIQDLPWESTFVTNSNHVFDLSALENAVNVRGFQNYHAKAVDGRLPFFEADDVLRLEQHPKLNENYPQLANYIRDHKAEYSRNNNRKISPQSITVLRNFATKMQAPQDAANFAEEFLTAKLAFEAHLAAISPEEKGEIENLNLIGGTDEEYALKKVLPKVYDGSWCKKGAARLILETTDRISSLDSQDDNVKVFWHQRQPSHWLGLDFVLRVR